MTRLYHTTTRTILLTITALTCYCLSQHSAVVLVTASTETRAHANSVTPVPSNPDDWILDILSYSTIASALRFTCEMNRQLNCASRASSSLFRETMNRFLLSSSLQEDDNDEESSSSSSYEPTKSEDENEEEELTLFHQGKANANTDKKKNEEHLIGVRRWGPDLTLYLTELHKALESSPLSLAYALIYLDRACSVETQRSRSYSHYHTNHSPTSITTRCPYLTPRTVHRLLLTAMVMAAKATDPETIIKSNAVGVAQYESSSKKYADKLKAFGVSETALAAMEAAMLAALGDERTYVSEHQLHACFRTWADIHAHAHAHASSSHTRSNDGSHGNSNNNNQHYNHQPRQMMMMMQGTSNSAYQHTQHAAAVQEYQQQQQQQHHHQQHVNNSSSPPSPPPASHHHPHHHAPQYSTSQYSQYAGGNVALQQTPMLENAHPHGSSNRPSSTGGNPVAVSQNHHAAHHQHTSQQQMQMQMQHNRAYSSGNSSADHNVQESSSSAAAAAVLEEEDMSSATDQQDVTNSLGYYWA